MPHAHIFISCKMYTFNISLQSAFVKLKTKAKKYVIIEEGSSKYAKQI